MIVRLTLERIHIYRRCAHSTSTREQSQSLLSTLSPRQFRCFVPPSADSGSSPYLVVSIGADADVASG
jgi:hypothetical protein